MQLLEEMPEGKTRSRKRRAAATAVSQTGSDRETQHGALDKERYVPRFSAKRTRTAPAKQSSAAVHVVVQEEARTSGVTEVDGEETTDTQNDVSATTALAEGQQVRRNAITYSGNY